MVEIGFDAIMHDVRNVPYLQFVHGFEVLEKVDGITMLSNAPFLELLHAYAKHLCIHKFP